MIDHFYQFYHFVPFCTIFDHFRTIWAILTILDHLDRFTLYYTILTILDHFGFHECLLLSTFSTFQTPLTLLTNNNDELFFFCLCQARPVKAGRTHNNPFALQRPMGGPPQALVEENAKARKFQRISDELTSRASTALRAHPHSTTTRLLSSCRKRGTPAGFG